MLAFAFGFFEATGLFGRESIVFNVTDIAWPLSMLWMMVVGVTVGVARRLSGWHRFVPLLCGLWFPLGMVAMIAFGDDSVFAAMRAGALGYLLEGASQEEVLRATNAVANGEAIFGPGIASRVMGLFSAPRPAAHAFPELTEREEEILNRIARGDNNAEIAGDLFLSLKTVQNRVSNIMRKLQVADRTQAAIRAREAGLGEG